jgi:hypothetical protein
MIRSRPSAQRRGAHWLRTHNASPQVLTHLPGGVVDRRALGRQWAVERGRGDLLRSLAFLDRAACVLHSAPRDEEEVASPAGDASPPSLRDSPRSERRSDSALLRRRRRIHRSGFAPNYTYRVTRRPSARFAVCSVQPKPTPPPDQRVEAVANCLHGIQRRKLWLG